MNVFVLPLVVALLAVGPRLNAIDGAVITSEDRELLPSGRSTASIVDLWLLELENLHPGAGGGIDRFDRLRFSSHGRSWTQTRFFLDGVDISDPAHPGDALINMPHGLWRRLNVRSLWTGEPGLHFEVGVGAESLQIDGALVAGGATGGGTWVPRKFMDREPATGTGADPDRRAQRRGTHMTTSVATASQDLSFELVDDVHIYPTLRAADGAFVEDRASRLTLTAGHRQRLGALPVETRLVWQREHRDREGAQWRHPLAYTLDRDSDALLGIARTRWRPSSRLLIEARGGFGWRRDDLHAADSTARVADVEHQWSWMQRLESPGRTDRSRLDASVDVTVGRAGGTPLRLHLRGSDSRITRLNGIPSGMTARSYDRASSSANRAVSVTVFGLPTEQNQGIQSLRAQVDTERSFGPLELFAVAALDYGRATGGGPLQVEHLSPAVGAAARWTVADSEFFLLLRREPIALTSEVSDFVDSDAPAGRTFRWNDDGDGIVDPGEAGALLARTGGSSHGVASSLRRPSSNQLALGWRSFRFGPFEAVLTGVVRLLEDRWIVRMAGPAADSYEPQTFSDPGGDGLGETTPKGQPQLLTVYARRPGTEGQEIYELGNVARANAYVGSEIQLRTVDTSAWFVNLGAKGYWNLGGAAFGLFADRNDPGVIDEVTADPNARINQWGRIDADRAFGINLIAGWVPFDGLSAATVLRYRDGEPLTRVVVVDDLPQGPTAIMAVPRGDPVPRFTFHMTVDLRLRYTVPLAGYGITAFVDVNNLFGSGTEILEDVRTGDSFRRSLEMVPGRTVYLGLAGSWQPS